MSKTWVKLIFTTAFCILFSAAAASAQLAYNGNMRVNMPFNFIVNGQTFSAGEYTFGRMPGIRDPATMLIMRGPEGKPRLFDTVMNRSPFGYARTSVVLKKVDGMYFLSKLTLEGQYTGYEFPMSRSERQMMAKARMVRDVVVNTEAGP